MDDPIHPSRDTLLESGELSKRVELARRLGDQPTDPQLAEKRLLRAFVHEIPVELREEAELSLLKLRDGVEENFGIQALDAEVHWSIYQDALKLNPSESVLVKMLEQADSWLESSTATRLAYHILSQAPDSWLCGQAIGVLSKHKQLDPAWYLEYFSTYCVKEFDDIDDELLTPLLESIDALGDRFGWDALRRRDEAMNRIRPALKKIETYSGPEEVLDWLTQCGPPEGMVEVLNEFLSVAELAEMVPPYLADLGEAARPTLMEILEGRIANPSRATQSTIEPALQVGISVAEILHALGRNTDRQAVGRAVEHLARLDEARTSAELGILTPTERSYLRDCLAEHLSEYLLRDLSYIAKRYGGYELEYLFRGFHDVYELRRLISRLQPVWGRRDVRLLLERIGHGSHEVSLIKKLFDSRGEMDFGLLTGMTLAEPLSFEYDDTLRFQYLLEYGRTANERPLRPLIANLTEGESPETLVGLEQLRDDTLDKLASLRSELEALERAEAERGERKEERRERGGGGRSFSPLEGEIRELEQYLNGSRFDPLRSASNKLIPALAERGVTFERWEPEGLLGEFRPPNRTATIYTGMIRLIAASPAMKTLGSEDEIESALRRIAEIHEAMHGQIILAHTCDGQSWQPYEESPYCLHEALASVYTRRFAESLDDNRLLLSVLGALESLLPAEYQEMALLNSLSGEDLRAFLLQARNSQTAQSVVETTNEVLLIARSEAGLLAAILDETAYDRLRKIVAEVSEEIRSAADAPSLVQACGALFRRITDEASEAIPLIEILGALDWPSEVQMAYWQILESCRGGTVGDASLRLRIEWIGETPGLSAVAGYEDIANSASLGLPNFEAAVEEAGLSPEDPSLRLLKERILTRHDRPRRARKSRGDEA